MTTPCFIVAVFGKIPGVIFLKTKAVSEAE